MVETTLDLRYNIAALCIAVLSEEAKTPEQAFDVIEGQKTCYTDKDSIDMYKLRKEMTLGELSDIYGMSISSILYRVRKVEKDLSAVTEKVN